MEKQNVDFGKVLLEIQESLVALNHAQAETQAAVVQQEQGVCSWKPQVEAAVQELRGEVEEIKQQLDLASKSQQASASTLSPRVPSMDEERKAPLLPTPPPTSLLASAEGGSKSAQGHH
jgi:predicted  nucleic acid-binding Zn-ribbon protein